MDHIRRAKVENVVCTKRGSQARGTLHLTAHHLIMCYDEQTDDGELWIPYPLISLVTRLPQTLLGVSPLTVRCRTFESYTFSFQSDAEALDVFDSVRELTVATSIQQLYAFFYAPSPPLPSNNGWTIYNPRDEFARMGVGTRTKAWRYTDINKDYTFCPTYPARLVVPTRISDSTLAYASKYRTKCRIPILAYVHWANFGSITRSSQPMVGITNNRSVQDEKLIEAIFQSHHSPESRAHTTPIYGATATNLIIDARPTTNAIANVAKGAGTENMEYYKEGKKAYLGIDNIHVMRESLARIVDALKEADAAAPLTNFNPDHQRGSFLDRQALKRSGWLRHISAILDGALLIVRNVHVNSSHVLIHCSDGWDRTAQLSSLSQLCLDPYYRTLHGFKILVEKDWLSFGHRFGDRCGHLSSEKFFVSPADGDVNSPQAFLASVQNKFVSPHHVKETSPVFHQFLECVRQLQRQFPQRFEFNTYFLEKLYYHLYSCQFGTFLFNNERERRQATDGGQPATETTLSVWDFFNLPAEKEKSLNGEYDKTLDDPGNRTHGADMGVLMPNPTDVRFWHELYGRTDEEMNGRGIAAQAMGAEILGPVEGEEDDPYTMSTSSPLTIPRTPVSRPSSTPPAFSLSPSLSGGAERVTPLDSSLESEGSLVLSSPSLPELPPRNTTPRRRQDSLRTSESASPGYASRSREPVRSPLGGFNTGGMKSIWGKISTNASTAFSVVQDVYGGVAKDLKGLSVSGPSGYRDGEYPSRDDASTWGELESDLGKTSRSSTISSGSLLGSSRTMVPPVADNPWNTSPRIGHPESDHRRRVDQDFFASTSQTSSPSHDPAVALPRAVPASSATALPVPDVKRPVEAESYIQVAERPPTLPNLPVPRVPTSSNSALSTLEKSDDAKSPGPQFDPLGVSAL
ncbi:phosphatases II [Sistotremastrum niveocremeum HHB9708]|uniref:Phosphatases II n=1 Tax=Sistotremastrum niveocremeum HHB9708 TaxID=1314777 RepID=A0A164P5H0_9AGAM|nr:phosphatases II [Sistotremastrum niveocremeum HHB9708]